MQSNYEGFSNSPMRPPGTPIQKTSRFLLSANLGFFVRLLRYGAKDSVIRLRENYFALAPFEAKPTASEAERTRSLRAQYDAIREVDVYDLVDPALTIAVDPRDRYTDGALPQAQLMMLLVLLHQQKPQVVLEIGTFCGATAKAMAINAPQATIHTVDLPLDFQPDIDPVSMAKDDTHLIRNRRVGEAFRGDPRCPNVVQHFGDSATWDFTPAQGATFILIDGAHTYEYCKSDTEKALAIAGPGALILWHDFDIYHPGVLAYIYELHCAGRPVVRLRDSYLAMMKTDA